MKNFSKGKLIEKAIHEELRLKFAYVEKDHHGKERLYLDNSGGSFRLKKSIEVLKELDLIPDCPERVHPIAKELINIIEEGKESIKKIVGSKSGFSKLNYTASICNFEIIKIAAEFLPGTNVVTTILEHPSSYDACVKICEKFGKTLRVAHSDPETGMINEDEILKLVDENTGFVNLIYASNITGSILNLETLIPKLRRKKPGLYVLSDAVQHAPHHLINFDEIGLDACTFAPYKMFGPRGIGVAFMSERFANLSHNTLIGKERTDWALGSPSPAFYGALTEIVNYVEWLGKNSPYSPGTSNYEKGMNAIFLHEKALLDYLLNGDNEQEGLLAIKGVNVHFLKNGIENRDCILGISFGDEDVSQTTKRFAQENVTVYERSEQSIYSRRMIEELGLKGVVRVSPLHIQTTEEMKLFIQITKKLAES